MQTAGGVAVSGEEARAMMVARIGAQLGALRRLDTGKRLRELAIFVGLWVGGMALVWAGLGLAPGLAHYGLRVAGTLAAAVAMNAFVLLLHEGMHGTLFAGRALNRWVAVALGLPTLISFTAYKVMHTRHHDYLGDPRDPDDYHNYSANPRVVWALHYLRLLSGAFLYIVLIPFLAYRHGSPEQRRHIVQEYAVLAAVGAAAAWLAPGGLLLHLWFIPVVIVGLLVNVRGFTQHGITDAHDAFTASRSMLVHPLVAFCLLNENLHLEHHLFPEVPSYHLPQLHALLWEQLPRAVVGGSYLEFLGQFVRATLSLDEQPIGLVVPGQDPAPTGRSLLP